MQWRIENFKITSQNHPWIKVVMCMRERGCWWQNRCEDALQPVKDREKKLWAKGWSRVNALEKYFIGACVLFSEDFEIYSFPACCYPCSATLSFNLKSICLGQRLANIVHKLEQMKMYSVISSWSFRAFVYPAKSLTFCCFQ